MPARELPTGAAKRRVLFASLVGTVIEFFDFYIYATAAVLVFPRLFFPASDPSSATLQSLATFALAFLARPIGSALFGHFGDRIGRRATLVAALMTMGLSTIAIGLLPTYAQIGIAAPALLALCRLGQGLGLGGEWGGAVLLATENAPPERRAWYAMFPQLGAPIGFFLATGVFLVLTAVMSDEEFFAWGWRIPFLASAALVATGLWVRIRIDETPAFQRMLDAQERVGVPMLDVVRRHPHTLTISTVAALATFVVFYMVSVFAITWGTLQLGYTREQFLWLQLVAVLFFAGTIPLMALYADRYDPRRAMIVASISIFVFGLLFAPLFSLGSWPAVLALLVLGMSLTGLTYGPIGALLAEQFPTAVRYTGASLAFNLAGIFGASLAPYIATWLAGRYGLPSVGFYLCAAALISLGALLALGKRAAAAEAP